MNFLFMSHLFLCYPFIMIIFSGLLRILNRKNNWKREFEFAECREMPVISNIVLCTCLGYYESRNVSKGLNSL